MSNVTANVGEDHKLMCTLIFGIDWVFPFIQSVRVVCINHL